MHIKLKFLDNSIRAKITLSCPRQNSIKQWQQVTYSILLTTIASESRLSLLDFPSCKDVTAMIP